MADGDAPIRLIVNGETVDCGVDAQVPLLLYLRNDLGLKGARAGCGVGECGACTVLVDGAPARACTTPLQAVAGCAVTTPEGLGTPDQPHRVQQAFLDEQAAQCGYCINGMIMTVAGLAERPACEEQDVMSALAEYICRCGSHNRVQRAARRVLGIDAGDTADCRDRCAGPPRLDAGHGVAADAPARPPVLDRYPRVESWVRLTPDGRIEVLTGKVEFGQGIRQAMAQLAASQIGVDVGLVEVLPASTLEAPDEAFTSGSHSVDHGGVAVATAAAAFRRLLLDRAAGTLGCGTSTLGIRDSTVVAAGSGQSVSLAELARQGPIKGEVGETDEPDWRLTPIDEALPRADLRHKLTGSPGYVHDLALPGMVHARALLPPTYDAVPRDIDTSEVERMPGVLRVVVDGRLIVVVALREEQAVRALARLDREVLWDNARIRGGEKAAPAVFRDLPAERYVASEPSADARGGATRLGATYQQPYQAHASFAPSCAVAVAEESVTRVWTHNQGVHPLQREIAAWLDEEPGALEVGHMDGPGCYGHNLADDAAGFAVLAARALPGTPVRFQFTSEDEFAWEPYGSALLADLEATLDDDGRVATWAHHTITDAHSARPRGSGTRLLVAWLQEGGSAPEWAGPREGGARNAVPLYDFPSADVWADHVRGPLRASALRGLGSFLNGFAAESFIDELAEAAGADPVAFRLAHLDDARAARVLEEAALRIGWEPRVGPSGRGLGLAVARYKGEKATVAQAVEVVVDTDTGAVSVRRVVTVCDTGSVVNPDGVVQQLEGGTIQGLSRALHEEVRYDGRGIQSRGWDTYPVIGFGEVPPIETVLVHAPGSPPLGVGEAALPPIAAALANAIDDAVGIRLRDLPFTPGAFERRLLEMSEAEASRVLAD